MFDGMLSPVSNKAHWTDCVEVTDAETGEPIDLTTALDIVLAVRFPGAGNGVFDGYYYASQGNHYGLTASLKDGKITLIQPGIFQFAFSDGDMKGLAPQTYDVGLVIVSNDGTISQLIIGQVPVLEGYAIGAAV